MRFAWDGTKDASNRIKHGLAFERVGDFDWGHAIIVNRSRHEDGETRLAAIGILDGRIHTIIFTPRGNVLRIISLRRANRPEERLYDAKTQTH